MTQHGRAHTSNQGLVKFVVIIIIGLIVLGYFGFDLGEIIEKPLVRNNLSYVWNSIVSVWNSYIERPAIFLWEELVLDILWENILEPLWLKFVAR